MFNLPEIGQKWPGTIDTFIGVMPATDKTSPVDYALLFRNVMLNMMTQPLAVSMLAKSRLHDMPTLAELRVMHAIAPQHFEHTRWYWSCETDPDSPGLAYGAWIERNPADGTVHCITQMDNINHEGAIVLVRRAVLAGSAAR